MIGGSIVESFSVTFLGGCEGAVNGLTVPGKDAFLIGRVSIVILVTGVKVGTVALISTDWFDGNVLLLARELLNGAEVIPTVTTGVVRFPIRADVFTALTLSNGVVKLLDGEIVFGSDDRFGRAEVTSAIMAVFCNGEVVLEIGTAFEVLLIDG